jgi:hypothetical protein
MRERFDRLAAIVRADFLIRLRRPSTVVVFLLLSAMAYLWVPNPSTGRALIQIDGRRALYNSAAIGMATAILGTLFVGLAGFYVISNALRRDVLSRCGYVIASTTMRGSEYIVGKFAGNLVFLSVFMLGFMATSMVMVLVRGEAPLEPLAFAMPYLLLAPPALVFVSAAAIFFECTPLLRSKFGDVAYFFLWLGTLGIVAAIMDKGTPAAWAAYFDVSGFGFMMGEMRALYHTNSMAIGSSPFNAAKGVFVFHGFHVTAAVIVPRVVSAIWPLSMLGLARVFFHRFDPARVRATPNEKSRRSWIGRLNLVTKPLARLFVRLGQLLVPRSGKATLLRSAATDALTTIAAFPLASLAIIGFAIAALASDAKGLLTGVMPIAFGGCAIAIADVACREKRSGTTALVYASPLLRARFVAWKFASALLLSIAFLAVPLARAITLRPSAALPLLVGLAFTCAAATMLGILSSNPKTFLVVFLSFWYVTTQDKGATPQLDFAGWFGTATPIVIAAYAALGLAMLAVAHLFHQSDLRRRW